jgi:hypothetical protein
MLVPPYGSDEAGLETIFDVKHLKKKASFLDTQCDLCPFSIHASLIFPQTGFPYAWESLYRRMSMWESYDQSTALRIILA